MEEEINSNYINENDQRNRDQFKKALEYAETKLNNLIQNSENYNDLNNIQKVFEDNMYISSIFKKKKLENNLINNNFFPKFSGEKINYFNTDIINKNKDDKANKIDLSNLNTNPDKIYKSNNNNNFNNNNNNSINSNKPINNTFFIHKEDNRYKNSNESTKVYISPSINVQNFIISHKNLDEISGHINTNNNINDNKMLLNFNSNINVNNNNNSKFIGKKRSLEEKTKENEENDNIYNDIKDLFNKYNKNNKDEKQNIIYEYKEGFFEQNETIIIENKPICIVYLNRNHINKIYLINDQSSIEDDKDIKDVLNKIKNELCHFMKNTSNKI